MNKTTLEALKLAEEALDSFDPYDSFEDLWKQTKDVDVDKALAAIRDALAEHVEQNLTMVVDHSGDANEMVYSKPSVFNGVCCGCSKKAADGYALYCVECWEKAEPVKQEPVAWYIFDKDLATTDSDWASENEDMCVPLYAEPVDAKAIRAEEQARHNKALKAQMAAAEAVGYIKSKASALDEPIAFVDLDRWKSGSRAEECFDHAKYDGLTPVYAAPIGTEHFLKAIAALREGIATCRAEALEEACSPTVLNSASINANDGPSVVVGKYRAAIRGLK